MTSRSHQSNDITAIIAVMTVWQTYLAQSNFLDSDITMIFWNHSEKLEMEIPGMEFSRLFAGFGWVAAERATIKEGGRIISRLLL